jgi:hypothetical protein
VKPQVKVTIDFDGLQSRIVIIPAFRRPVHAC